MKNTMSNDVNALRLRLCRLVAFSRVLQMIGIAWIGLMGSLLARSWRLDFFGGPPLALLMAGAVATIAAVAALGVGIIRGRKGIAQLNEIAIVTDRSHKPSSFLALSVRQEQLRGK